MTVKAVGFVMKPLGASKLRLGEAPILFWTRCPSFLPALQTADVQLK